MRFGGIFDGERKQRRLLEVTRELEDPTLWQQPDKAQALGQERARLQEIVQGILDLKKRLIDARELQAFLVEEPDPGLFQELCTDTLAIDQIVDKLEFQRMFSGRFDSCHAYLDIQAGSGGTEAQDWAEMLLRMYLRFSDQRGFKATLMEVSAGEVAGIKSATVFVEGEYAFGWLRTETGVHRLVRKSPFDSGNRRHTSFASVFVSPEIDEKIEVDINPADLRIDTYRASGAGGQHVNRTDSAVRITHVPTGIVVQCQSDRSQHKNRAQAMKQLRAKLYELEEQKQNAEKAKAEANKADISWGSQIRSYVLDDSRVKDLRTGVETTDTQRVLDGGIERFIEACLKQISTENHSD